MKKLSKINKNQVSSTLREYGGTSAPVSNSGKSSMDFGFFKDVLKRKRLEVVVPEMHYMDSEILERMYERDLQEKFPELYERIKLGEVAKVPQNILHDLFQMHLLRTEDSTFELSDVNSGSYSLIKKMNDADMKMITNYSPLNSYLMAKNLMFYLQKQLDDMQEPPPQDQGQGGSGDDNLGQKLSDALDQQQSSGNGGDPMDSAKQQAKQEIQDAENGKDLIDQLGEGQDAGKGDSIRQVEKTLINKKMLRDIDMSNKTLSDMLKHSLDSSVKYFTAMYTEYRESVFEAEEVHELLGLEAMTPAFRMFKLDELETVSRKYRMAIDVYIDISGSMTSSQKLGKYELRYEDIAKLLALKIGTKGILKDIYMFDTDITGPHSKKKMMEIRSGGGTCLNTVIRQVRDLKRPAVIITDAQDRISEYSELAYFIGIGNPRLNGPTDIMKQYKANKQGIEYTADNQFKEITIHI